VGRAPALAKESTQSVIDDAKALQGKGDEMKAAARFGDAVALAQAEGDLAAEDIAAGALDGFLAAELGGTRKLPRRTGGRAVRCSLR